MPRPHPTTPDNENPEWTADMFARARPLKEAAPELYAALAQAKRGRGPQKAPTKQLVSLRLSRSVLAAYRRTGRGWQARMNADLERAAARLPRRATRAR